MTPTPKKGVACHKAKTFLPDPVYYFTDGNNLKIYFTNTFETIVILYTFDLSRGQISNFKFCCIPKEEKLTTFSQGHDTGH